MIKRLQTLLEDANKRNEITNQTLTSFRVPKFEEERAMRGRLLMLQNENLRLKDELDNLVEKTSKVKKETIFPKNSKNGELSDLEEMMQLRGAMKAENRALKSELKGIQLSKEAMVYEMKGLTKDEDILRLRKIIQEYQKKENRSFPKYMNREGDVEFNTKCLIVEKLNKRFDVDLKKYLFAIWRLKFLLKRTLRMKNKEIAFNFKEEISSKKSENNVKQQKLFWIWEELRRAIAIRIFEIFLRSQDEKNEGKKKNYKSYIIFKINVEEFIGNDDKLLLILLRLYIGMVNSLGSLIPRQDRIKKLQRLGNLNSMEVDDYKEVNPYGIYDAEVRDTINEWVEKQIVEVKKRRRVTGKDKVEKEMLTLFRYLSIYYKTQYPYSNKQAYRVDKDLVSYLENLVCRTLSRLVGLYEEDLVIEGPDEEY